MMNEKKICFIICTNDDVQLQECILYLDLLHVPEGYQTELITVKDAASITSGYNEGMRASDAKYKIYLHQDCFIVERFFLDKLLKLFKKDKSIGMIGTLGAEILSSDGVMWHEERCGSVYLPEQHDNEINLLKRGYREVEVIDGLLMATQYDLPWREDIFQGWHFYDVSQCMEFRRAGYRIIVPGQKKNWVIHSCGMCSLSNYEEYRHLLLQEYPEIGKRSQARKRILFFHSKQIKLPGMVIALMQLGHSVTLDPYWVDIEAWDDAATAEQEKIEEILEEGHYDLVITYALIPTVSNACESMKVPYYCWVYDSPLLTLYSAAALNQVNYISVFDRKQYERLTPLGLKHLFYLPLAAETDHFGAVCIRKRDEKKYGSDISFVGRLYNDGGLEDLLPDKESNYYKEAMEIVHSLHCCWDNGISFYGQASQELIDDIVSRLPKEVWETWSIDKRYYCESLKLARKCNEIERIHILQHIRERFPIVLYSDKSAKHVIKGIEVRPWLDYNSEMPKVFHLSKINLNITSRSIESGIPQRIWDILAVGGFCLTNYQPELEEYFEIGKDLEVYHNLQELDEKIEYYLTHEEQRLSIAMNGYKKVHQHHSLRIRLAEVLQRIFGDNA